MTADRKVSVFSGACTLAWAVVGLMASMTVGQAATIATHPAAVRIELRANPSVPQTNVTLGQVANLTSRDLEVLEALMALPLGQVPSSGEAVSLDRDVVTRWIRSASNLDPSQIDWRGAPSTSVRLATRSLSGEDVANAAQDYLRGWLRESGLRGEVATTRAPQDISVPAGKLELRARPLAASRVQEGTWHGGVSPEIPPVPMHQSLWVDVWVDGRPVRTVVVGFEIAIDTSAPLAFANPPAPRPLTVAASEERRGMEHALDRASDEPLEPRPSSRGSDARTVASSVPRLLESSEAADFRHPAQPVMKGTSVATAGAPLVVRGSYATLHSIQGQISLESRVEVLQDGTQGQPIRVKLPNGSSSIVATVVGPGAVEVRE